MHRGRSRADKETRESRAIRGRCRARDEQMYKLNVAWSKARRSDLRWLMLLANERKMPG